MASSSARRDKYKIESEFGESRPGVNTVTHRTFKTDPGGQQPIEVRTTWVSERMLGGGAFGEVRLESEQGTGKLRAVKVIAKRQVNINEVETLIDLQDHPTLFVRFLGWFEDPYALHLAMEYIEHGDLAQYITQHGEKAKADARDITSQILKGLVVLHEREICHRDLKPQNILIASPLPITVKITDFGISKNWGGTELRTHCGTTPYKAPELQGMLPRSLIVTSRSYTKNVDLWSLGALVHELLTSEIPFLEKAQIMNSGVDQETQHTAPKMLINSDLLYQYCRGEPFPAATLQDHGASLEQIDFIKGLMIPNPMNRVSAADALKSRWLSGMLERNSPAHILTRQAPPPARVADLTIRPGPSRSPPPPAPTDTIRPYGARPDSDLLSELLQWEPGSVNLPSTPLQAILSIIVMGESLAVKNFFALCWWPMFSCNISRVYGAGGHGVQFVEHNLLPGPRHAEPPTWKSGFPHPTCVGVIYLSGPDDEPHHAPAHINSAREFCFPKYLQSTVICITTGLGENDEFVDGPISCNVPSEWDGLVKSGVIICRGSWKSITEYIADKQPKSEPSAAELGGVQ